MRGKGRRERGGGGGGGRDREGEGRVRGRGVWRGRWENRERRGRVINLLPLFPDTFKKMSRRGSSVHLSRDDVR